VIERESTTSPLGLSLAEGKELLASAQKYFVAEQSLSIAGAHSYCSRCGVRLGVKGWHQRQIRTVFGLVDVRSPRLRCCACAGRRPGASVSPMVEVLPTRVTPELEYLQVKWAAHLPYAQATALLSDVLPIADVISVSGLKRRVRAVGAALDSGQAPCATAATEKPLATRGYAAPRSVAVDSAWLKHCEPPPRQARHVNLVAGRVCFEDGRSRVYAYVHNQVPSAAARLDRFLSSSGIGARERLTILCDAAGEFEKAVQRTGRPLCRIVDWFHIAMMFRAIEQTALKYPGLLAPNGETIMQEIKSAKWLVWHGKAPKAVTRLKSLHDAFELLAEERYSTLEWNLRKVWWYLRSNDSYLVNYGRRYRKGLPISSATAESAVNQVVSSRMAKQRQMRWSDEGAHLLAQVRVHVINNELRPRAMPIPLCQPKPIPNSRCDAELLKMAA
jgi:hypothetical protein